MTTLVIDTGRNIIGIFFVEECEYLAYRGNRIVEALKRIESADEVITFNGECRDLLNVARFAGVDGDFLLKGEHFDMQVKVWAPLIWSSQVRTYNMHSTDCTECPFSGTDSEKVDDYEVANRCDVYMTLKLWELWKENKLRLMGYGYLHHSHGGLTG